MAPQPDVALTVAYRDRYNRLRSAAGVAVGRAWDRFANVDDAAADRFAEIAAGVAVAAQTQVASNVDGYVAVLLGVVTGSGTPEGVDGVTGAAARNGAEPVEVYHRPIITARTGLSEGTPWAEAMALGRLRAVLTAETDVALAQRATMARLSDRRIVGYRRVLTGSSCALCATASTQRYRRGDLMPMHPACDCSVAPLIGDRDPGQVIDRQLVADLKKAGKTSGDPQYWRSRHITVDADGTVTLPKVATRQHGELGPTLVNAGHVFSGPGVIAA